MNILAKTLNLKNTNIKEGLKYLANLNLPLLKKLKNGKDN